ncbi:MAG TPA: DUF427 domain-containing protein [Jiangellaceae bacterium]
METRQRNIRIEQGAKRVRTYLGGHVIADTTRPFLVWEIPYYPAYYIPKQDVRTELLTPTGETTHSTSRGDGTLFTIKAGDGEAAGAAWQYEDSPIEELRDLIRIDWNAMDAWFEEDEQVYTHPRDPYKRVDILASSRHVRIELDGVTLAESSQPRILFETGLPQRYYLPKTDARLDLLVPSDKETHCPYKGTASYYSAPHSPQVGTDVAWWYPTPLPESQKIAGLICFYDERVDVFIDGEKQARPKSPFA